MIKKATFIFYSLNILNYEKVRKSKIFNSR